jgi:hypothetical protein
MKLQPHRQKQKLSRNEKVVCAKFPSISGIVFIRKVGDTAVITSPSWQNAGKKSVKFVPLNTVKAKTITKKRL